MIDLPVEVSCVVCGKVSVQGGHGRRLPELDEGASGLDLRPSFVTREALTPEERRLNDARWGGLVWPLEECPHCGHVAPNLRIAYPRAAESAGIRAAVDARGYSTLARRPLHVAALFGAEDPRQAGFWVLRAAWAEEAHGQGELSAEIRGRAGELLEQSLWQGRALSATPGASALILCETFRLAGEERRALEHVTRVLGRLPDGPPRDLLLVAAQLVMTGHRGLVTRAEARARLASALAEPGRSRVVASLVERAPPPAAIVVQPLRMFVDITTLMHDPPGPMKKAFVADYGDGTPLPP